MSKTSKAPASNRLSEDNRQNTRDFEEPNFQKALKFSHTKYTFNIVDIWA